MIKKAFKLFIALTLICLPVQADIERKVKVSSNDSTSGFLNGKLVAGSNVTLTEGSDGGNETLTISASGGGGGSAVTLDLADDDTDESTDLSEIATSGDTNSIFSEPTPDKLLITLSNDWPKADDADDVTCSGCVADGELATDFVSEAELDTETELETQLTDVSDVITNNDSDYVDQSKIADDAVQEEHLKAVDTPTDEDIVTYESTTGDFEYHTCAEITGSADLCDGDDATGGNFTDSGSFLEPNTNGDGIQVNNAGDTSGITISVSGTEAAIDLVGSGATYRFNNLVSCDTIDTDSNGVLSCGTDASGGGGTPNILDLGDDGSDESTDLVEIAVTNDTNSIFSEPTADKLLINASLNWPSSDTADALSANGANCTAGSAPLGVDASGAVESCTDYEEDLSNEAGLYAALSDVTQFYEAGDDVTSDVTAATDSAAGKVELATTAEIDTGTDATRAITPDALAASDHGLKYFQVLATTDFDADTAVADGAFYVHVPAGYGGMDLVEVHAEVVTAGTTGTTDVQIHNVTDTADMLSTKITIDSGETGSDTAATPAVINTANDDVAENDVLRVDIDAVSTTAAKGLIITLGFRKP